MRAARDTQSCTPSTDLSFDYAVLPKELTKQ